MTMPSVRLAAVRALIVYAMVLVPGHLALADSLKLSLDEARRLAFERNWDLLASKANVDAALARRLVAKEFPNPTLSLSSAKIPADSAQPVGTALGNDVFNRSYDTIIAVNQLIEIGGKRSARRASALAGHESAVARFDDARRQLDLAVSRAYIAVLKAESTAAIMRESAASLRKESTIAAQRLRVGDISSSDQLQIEIAADRMELDARKAVSDSVTAKIQMEVLLGLAKAKGEFMPSESLDALATGAEGGLPASGLQGSRPDVRAAEADARKADADLRLERAQRIPDPTVLLQYEHEPPDRPHTIGIGLSFPLPLWNRNRGSIAAAEAARRSAEVNAAKTGAIAAAENASSRNDWEAARGRWDDYARRIRPKSASIRDNVTFAYEKGGSSLIELLLAQRNDNEVRLSATEAAADLVLTRAAWRAASATILPNHED